MSGSGLVELVDRVEQALPEMVDSVVEAIIREIDVYSEVGLVPRGDLRRSVDDNLRFMLRALRDPTTPKNFSAPRETGRRRASQGTPLPEVIRAFRLCFTGLWDRLAAEVRLIGGPQSTETLLDAASAIWQLTDEYALALTESYRSTSAELLLVRQQRRSALAEVLFTGVGGPEGWPWEASRLLGLPDEGQFVVVCAETSAGTREGLPFIEHILSDHDLVSLWRLTAERQMGIVALGAGGIDTVLAVVGAVARTRTGISSVYQRLRDSPRLLHLADVAAQTLPTGTAGVAVFRESPLAELVAHDQDASARLTRSVLGPVLDLPPDDREPLLETARAWFDCGGSAERAGQMVYCHANTVRYRLRRLQDLTGRSLSDPWSVAEFASALHDLALRKHTTR